MVLVQGNKRWFKQVVFLINFREKVIIYLLLKEHLGNSVQHVNREQGRKSEIFKGSREHATSFPYALGPNSENTWTVVYRVWLGIINLLNVT